MTCSEDCPCKDTQKRMEEALKMNERIKELNGILKRNQIQEIPVYEGCNHTFTLSLYIPPGQWMVVQCPQCGAPRKVFGSGAVC